LEVAIQIRLRQLLGTGDNGERYCYRSIRRIRLRDAGTQSSCGAGRVDDKRLALRQPWNAPNDCVGSQDYRDLHCPVTLKVISEKYLGDESARLRFLREARAAASVRHTNVASVFHLGRTGDKYFYAMEFVDGETLENLIRRSGRLESKLALEVATQVAAGLAAIQEQKLVHVL